MFYNIFSVHCPEVIIYFYINFIILHFTSWCSMQKLNMNCQIQCVRMYVEYRLTLNKRIGGRSHEYSTEI